MGWFIVVMDSVISTLAQGWAPPACYSNTAALLCLYHYSADTFLRKVEDSEGNCKRATETI